MRIGKGNGCDPGVAPKIVAGAEDLLLGHGVGNGGQIRVRAAVGAEFDTHRRQRSELLPTGDLLVVEPVRAPAHRPGRNEQLRVRPCVPAKWLDDV
jgi:hypothetical protein